MLEYIVELIRAYESDTFSAQERKILRREAFAIARTLTDEFVRVVGEGGTLTCDGVRLGAMLDELRQK